MRPHADDHPAALFRHVLLVQALPHAQQQVDQVDLTGRRAGADHRNRRALDAKVQVARNHACGGAFVLGVGLTDNATKHIAIDRDLKLLGCVVGPHRHDVEIGLDLHHVVENHAEVQTIADEEFDRAAGRTIEPKQTVRKIRPDRNRGLCPDFYSIAHILDFAFQRCYRSGSLSTASACFHAARTISSPVAGAGRSWADYRSLTA
jgi:hypothetical protein